MYTYTGGRNLYGQLTNNSTTSNLSLGDTLINQYTNETIHAFPDVFTEKTDTNIVTFPSQQFYETASRIRRIISVVVTVGGFSWTPRECPSITFWNQLNLVTNITSDIPQYWFFYNGQLGLYPKPASGYNTVTTRYQTEIIPLTWADYTTGTITTAPYTLTFTGSLASGATSGTLSATWGLTTATYEITFSNSEKRLVTLTNGSAAVSFTALTSAATSAITVSTSNSGSIVIGSGTSWATYMASGGYLSITQTTGDGFWYEIDTVYSATALSLKKKYQGTAISSGSATYTIGQASVIPDTYQFIPILRATNMYYVINPDQIRKDDYEGKADSLFTQMKADYGNKSTDPTLYDNIDRPIINPNLTLNTTQSS